jgi:hypothetical protein
MYDLIKAAVPASTDIAVDDTEVDNAAAVFDADGVTEMAIVTDVDAFSDQMNDEIDDKILPRFRRGMQNIGAVVSSAFPLGEALIYAFGARDVAKYNGDLRVAATLKNADVDIAIMNKNLEVSKSNLSKDVQVALANMNKDIEIGEVNAHKDLDYERLYISGTEQMVNFIAQKFGWLSNYTQFAVESNRIKIVAKSEQAAKDAEIDENDALWDLEVLQYGANLLAAPAGGTAVTRTKASGNTGASVLGGAMSGVAAGSMISPGIGTVVGAVVGGAAGYFMS